MGKAIDLTGRTFGSLYVISKADSKTYTYPNGKCTVAYWDCRCDGGGRLCKGAGAAPVASGHLLSGHTISCGCKRAFRADNSFAIFQSWFVSICISASKFSTT